MDVFNLIKAVWKLIENKKYAVNINTVDKLITLSILKDKKVKKRFEGYNCNSVFNQVQNYLG
jgi:hypothetical protein